MMVAPVWARTELEPHRLERCRGAYLRVLFTRRSRSRASADSKLCALKRDILMGRLYRFSA